MPQLRTGRGTLDHRLSAHLSSWDEAGLTASYLETGLLECSNQHVGIRQRHEACQLGTTVVVGRIRQDAVDLHTVVRIRATFGTIWRGVHSAPSVSGMHAVVVWNR